MPQSTVADIVTELRGTGTGPYVIMDNSNITSGMIATFINEADAVLRGWVGLVSGAAVVNEQALRFEVNYASAKLLSSLVGIVITDGFNYSIGGLDIQRVGSKVQTYELMISTRLELARWYIKMLQDWFFVYKPDNAQGYTETGTPVSYWVVR